MIKKFLDITFLKFVLVGVINTIVGTAVMFLCYNAFHCSYWFSSAMNYVIGSIVSYFLNKYFTFQNKERSWKIVAKFIINITICYLAAYGLAKPLVAHVLSGQTVNIQENGGMLVGMVLFVILNYLGQRFFTFKKREEKG
jgi:putative flippase GtrA